MDSRKLSLICSLLNLPSEDVTQLRMDSPELTGRVVFDRFNFVQISRTNKNFVWLNMRSGFHPYITYKNNTDNNCYKLFVDCR